MSNELNIHCTHEAKEGWTNFCYNCGAIWMKQSDSGSKVYSIKYKPFNFQPEIPPIETFNQIERAIGYKSYFMKIKNNMNVFYKKARTPCVKFIKKLVEENQFSARSFVAAVLYLDLIYLNYDYYTIMKEFKSELIALGCFLLAGKHY